MSIKSILAPPAHSRQDCHINFDSKGRLVRELCWVLLLGPLNSLRSKEGGVAFCSPFSEIQSRAVLQLLTCLQMHFTSAVLPWLCIWIFEFIFILWDRIGKLPVGTGTQISFPLFCKVSPVLLRVCYIMCL